MNRLNHINWDKVGRFLGSLKFAIVVISLFTLGMILGTFLESYYGTDFANRIVYKTFPFMLIQFGMFVSIIFAAVLRLPPKKRLYGFYVIHSGLIIIGLGSLITYIAGVDGQISLAPNEPNRQVILSKDILKITYPSEGKQVSTVLPYSAFAKDMDESYENIKIKQFIPFSEGKFVWADPINKYSPSTPTQSSKYHFKNAFAEQDFLLTVHPEAGNDFQSSLSMGPLNITYYPENIANCFEADTSSGIIIWNTQTAECFTPEQKKYPVKTTTSKNKFLVVPTEEGLFTFFPEISPYPMDLKFQANENSKLRAFSKKLFEDKPNLFLFGKKLAFFSKEDKKWHVNKIELNGGPADLPWMGAQISLLDHQEKLVPFNIPTPTIPIQKNGSLIKGDLKAVRLEILGNEYWVSNYNPLSLSISGKKIVFEVAKETLTLPFELALTEFKMDKDPGTSSPASYESFVKLFDNGISTNHHVFMNNPLKKSGYTFYQASYAQDSQGQYSSTLSVNVDQGRFLKYLGSLMLVFGAIWHFNLQNTKKSKVIT
jgi:hypothetical protein